MLIYIQSWSPFQGGFDDEKAQGVQLERFMVHQKRLRLSRQRLVREA
jgi:hypothetical protein